MIRNDKELIVVGDRVLVKVEDGEERTKVGLYLPSTAIDSQAVQGGTIVATGPGQPMPAFDANSGEEPWKEPAREVRVRIGSGIGVGGRFGVESWRGHGATSFRRRSR